MKTSDAKIVFFGSPELSVTILNKMKSAGIIPALIVTAPDKPAGRGRVLTPPPVKLWADENGIETEQPVKIKGEFTEELANTDWDLFIVAAYGKILPQTLLDIPKHGTINVHPSLLPRLRGPSPIVSAILEDEKETGVSIMLLDAGMDSGPVLSQARIELEEWPPTASLLEAILSDAGGDMLVEAIPQWLNGEITPEEQDHDKKTICKMIKKEDALINLADDPYQNLLKIRAYEGWPGAYTFIKRNDKDVRIKINSAHLNEKTEELVLDKIVPEGKKEMLYTDFMRG